MAALGATLARIDAWWLARAIPLLCASAVACAASRHVLGLVVGVLVVMVLGLVVGPPVQPPMSFNCTVRAPTSGCWPAVPHCCARLRLPKAAVHVPSR